MMMQTLSIAVFVVAMSGCSSQKPQAVNHVQLAVHSPEEMAEYRWVFQGDEGVGFVSDVWNIRTTIKYQHILDSLPMFYDALIQRYTTVFGELPYPKKRMDVFLFATVSQWQSQLEIMLGETEAKHWFQLKSGGVTIDGTAVLYHLDRRGRSRVTLRIAAHEGWHQYAENAFAACLPTWLDEGIGTWMEGFRMRLGKVQFLPASNWDRLTNLRTIVDANRLYSLKTLMQSDPATLLSAGRTTLLGYYAQLWGLISFIVEYDNGKYLAALEQLLQRAVDGTIQEPSLGWLYCITDFPSEFEKEYRTWVAEYVRPSSRWR